MLQNLINFLRSIIKNDYVIAMLLSILPMVEVRGAVPISIAMGINEVVTVLLTSTIGTLAVIPNMIFVKPFLDRLKQTKTFSGVANNFEQEISDKSLKIEDKAKKKRLKNFSKYLAIVLFVGLPLPFTGGYTGSVLAVFLNLELVKSEIAILIGNILASTIMTILSVFFKEQLDIIVLILTIIFSLTMLVYGYKLIFGRKVKNQKKSSNKVF